MEELKKPIGWPEDLPFPIMTLQEEEECWEKIIEEIKQRLEEWKKKVPEPSPEVLRIRINI